MLLIVAVACLAATAVTRAAFQRTSPQAYFGSLGAYGVDARDPARSREEFERARILDGMDFLAITSAAHASSVSAIAASLNVKLANRFVAMYGWHYGAILGRSDVSVLEPSETRDEPDGPYELFYRPWPAPQMDTTGKVPVMQFGESRDPSAADGRLDAESLEHLRSVTAPYARTLQIAGRSTREPAGTASSDGRALAYFDYLNAGFRIAPTADWPGAWRGAGVEHRTAVLAQSLTRLDLLDSIRARRVYATDDNNLYVSFSINRNPMGSIVPLGPETPLRIELTVSDPNEPDALYWVSLRHDRPGGALEAAVELSGTDFRGNGTVVFTQFRRSVSDEYFLVHLVQQDADGADHVWTAPIWLVSPP
jgi:hypothetical protein